MFVMMMGQARKNAPTQTAPHRPSQRHRSKATPYGSRDFHCHHEADIQQQGYGDIRRTGQGDADIRVPVLAIFAVPHDPGLFYHSDPAALAVWDARDLEQTGALVNAFERGVPSARVVRLPYADHYVFFTNEADVLREMRAFIGSLSYT
jgi:hypothetical protein